MFIRVKHIKGNPYAYLVENTWKKGEAKQKVKQYLGRIHFVEVRPEPRIQDEQGIEVIQVVAEQEVGGQANVNIEDESVTIKDKEVVIGINGGFLCKHTITQVRKALYVRNEEQPGFALAKALSDAGLRIAPQAFIKLYKEFQ